MAHKAPARAFIVNYWENPRIRAVRIEASRAGKKPYGPARNTYWSVRYDFKGFRRLKTSKLFTARKANANNIVDQFSVHILVTYLFCPNFIFWVLMKSVKSPYAYWLSFGRAGQENLPLSQ